MDEDELEAGLDRSFKLGISEGFIRAANYVMEQAKDAFVRFGNDESKSGRLRNIANELHVQSHQSHPDVKTERDTS